MRSDERVQPTAGRDDNDGSCTGDVTPRRDPENDVVTNCVNRSIPRRLSLGTIDCIYETGDYLLRRLLQ